MKKVKGFFIFESAIAIIISLFAVSCLYLTVAESQKNGREMELKTDRVYAYHVLKANNLDQITVHDHVYERIGQHYLNDKNTNQKYKIAD
ncbi:MULTISPECIES: hypothetical protein [Lactobacillus]|nr:MULTISPECIES: hypothetical protein [Lactobacillus]NMB31497.1 hypothetical protein [Lactobacillus sp.]HJF39895.1 hypothetical protein [Thomasclavelia spiroformis]KRL25025.1 hypothetical protein FC37_GL000032 [Lactobacillus gallinarum DSM 10532 = JCM 2011]MBM6958987.1 hypothetical protein [Lactobacillus gallinarum]MBM6973280.1 hypothetical protein [Lactobacillus gallinarum]